MKKKGENQYTKFKRVIREEHAKELAELKRTVPMSVVHHTPLATQVGQRFVVKTVAWYQDSAVVGNLLVVLAAIFGLFNASTIHSLMSGNPEALVLCISGLGVAIANIVLKVFYSKNPVTLV